MLIFKDKCLDLGFNPAANQIIRGSQKKKRLHFYGYYLGAVHRSVGGGLNDHLTPHLPPAKNKTKKKQKSVQEISEETKSSMIKDL